MSKFLKLKEFTKKELRTQLENNLIDIDFLIDYIVKRDKVYNKLIDEIERLEKELENAKDK